MYRGAVSSELFDPVEQSIDSLGAALREGATTSVELVERYSARIEAHDGALNAIARMNPGAFDEAAERDRERSRGATRGPLHGIPVVVKDNFETIGMVTGAGSRLLAGFEPGTDAEAVARLRSAGAVLLAKTNMHEFAYGILTVGSGFGETHNPYDLRRNPGGSSGGTGASIAASFAAVGMGSDTCGSIRIPAAHNNLVGIRGTQGLSSRRGIVPLSSTQDIGGPLGRCVRDVVHTLDATVGSDAADPQTRDADRHIPKSYAAALEAPGHTGALRGAKIGILQNLLEVEPEDAPVARIIRGAAEELAALGAVVVETAIAGLNALLDEPFGGWVVLYSDFKHDINAYLSERDAPVASLEEIVASALFHPEIADALNRSLGSDVTGEAYRVGIAQRGRLRGAIEATLAEQGLDALAYPTIRRVAAPIGAAQQGTNCRLSANSGLPAISVPAGFCDEGLPVGLELLARAWDEPLLLGLAYAFEQGTKHRRAPTLGADGARTAMR